MPQAEIGRGRPAALPGSHRVIVMSFNSARSPSRTQYRILRLAAVGLTDKEIARRLGISYRTVRTHLERLYERLGIRGRTAVVAWYCSSIALPTVGNNADLPSRPTDVSIPMEAHTCREGPSHPGENRSTRR